MNHKFIGQLRELDVRIKLFSLGKDEEEQLRNQREHLAEKCDHKWPDGDTANYGTSAVCVCQICGLEH